MLSEPMVSETRGDNFNKESAPERTRSRRRFGAFSKIAEQEWSPGILFLILDVVCWVSLYTLLISVRHDIYFSGRFEYVVVYLVQLAVLVQSLFIIGGYSASTETRGLAYNVEHMMYLLRTMGYS